MPRFVPGEDMSIFVVVGLAAALIAAVVVAGTFFSKYTDVNNVDSPSTSRRACRPRRVVPRANGTVTTVKGWGRLQAAVTAQRTLLVLLAHTDPQEGTSNPLLLDAS
jgi:hypothetical protein